MTTVAMTTTTKTIWRRFIAYHYTRHICISSASMGRSRSNANFVFRRRSTVVVRFVCHTIYVASGRLSLLASLQHVDARYNIPHRAKPDTSRARAHRCIARPATVAEIARAYLCAQYSLEMLSRFTIARSGLCGGLRVMNERSTVCKYEASDHKRSATVIAAVMQATWRPDDDVDEHTCNALPWADTEH